jgi:hypothetical protein
VSVTALHRGDRGSVVIDLFHPSSAGHLVIQAVTVVAIKPVHYSALLVEMTADGQEFD